MDTKYNRLADEMNDVMERVNLRLDDLEPVGDEHDPITLATMAIAVALASVADEIRELRKVIEEAG